MRFYDLIKKYNFEDVYKRLIEIYPKEINKDAYEYTYKELNTLILEPIINDEFEIIIEKVEDIIDKNEFYYSVSDFNSNEPNERYSLLFQRWEKVLGQNIYEITLKELTEIDIVVYILYEITFCGYSQEDIEVERKELMDIVDDADENIKNGNWERFKSIDELLEDLHDEED